MLPSGWWYHTDEKDFDDAKERYKRSLDNQYAHLHLTICPLINKPCIECNCTSYVEPVPPYKDILLIWRHWFNIGGAITFDTGFVD